MAATLKFIHCVLKESCVLLTLSLCECDGVVLNDKNGKIRLEILCALRFHLFKWFVVYSRRIFIGILNGWHKTRLIGVRWTTISRTRWAPALSICAKNMPLISTIYKLITILSNARSVCAINIGNFIVNICLFDSLCRSAIFLSDSAIPFPVASIFCPATMTIFHDNKQRLCQNEGFSDDFFSASAYKNCDRVMPVYEWSRDWIRTIEIRQRLQVFVTFWSLSSNVER